jgi:hypothetical protein
MYSSRYLATSWQNNTETPMLINNATYLMGLLLNALLFSISGLKRFIFVDRRIHI